MKKLLFIFAALLSFGLRAQNQSAGASERMPSVSEYFSWINNTNEGATEAHTIVNLDFFRWLEDKYGMKLDIYAFDAGAIDGAKMYGSMDSDKFRSQFPRGFGPLADYAAERGTRLGLWGGPDGFGDTVEQAEKRIETMVSLCRDFNFRLFKLDAVCGQLRPEKYDYFDRMMTECRRYSPDLIMLNHRLQLGEGARHSTTFLLGGAETYIDVFMANDVTAPHNRAKAISREVPPGLTRLTEDHGVCLSSCLDYWEDDLVLQAFNRNLIVAPQIYGNPWLLRDEEFSYLAFIFNLHRKYNDILVDGIPLAQEKYGPDAVSRGNENTRFITLRNLTWEPVRYTISLNEEVGLHNEGKVKVRQYHPCVYDMGEHAYGSSKDVVVLPFRSALIKVTTVPEEDRIALSGIPYRIVEDKGTGPVEVRLLGRPGEKYDVNVASGESFDKAEIHDGGKVSRISLDRSNKVKFPGKTTGGAWHRKLAVMAECEVPADAEAIYYATAFAADNNALEVRSLERSGPTRIPQVQVARDAFFGQELFREREIWDKYLFDGDPQTAFSVAMRWGDPRVGGASGLCLDMGETLTLDKLVIETFDEYSLSPLKSFEGVYAYTSTDMQSWTQTTFIAGKTMEVELSNVGAFRYLRFSPCPLRVSEITGYIGGKKVDRTMWRASNLFRPYGTRNCRAHKAWSAQFVVDNVEKGAYLCVAVNGIHGVEGVWVGFKVDGEYVGSPDRAPSFTSNTWEYRTRAIDRNYTYYLPLTKNMEGKKIEAVVLGMDAVNLELSPEVWMTAYPIPFEEKTLIFQ